MSDFLEKIKPLVLKRVKEARLKRPLDIMVNSFSRQAHPFCERFKGHGKRIIAEVKRASPSQGEIAMGQDPVAVATGYLSVGAAAISVLTEPHFFGGHWEFLHDIRVAHPNALLLMKDFILDEYQIVEARWIGADACLLMVSLLSPERLKTLYNLALELGLTPLVEVHDADEMNAAKNLGAKLIGINNRNLKTLKVDLQTSQKLIQMSPQNSTLICESGIHTLDQLEMAQKWGFDGFLIGTHFMRQTDPSLALKLFLEGQGEA